MDRRIKISSFWIWTIVLLLCLMGISLLQSWVIIHKTFVLVTPGVPSSEPVSKETGFTGEANKENNPASVIGEAPSIINPSVTVPKTVTTDNKHTVVQTAPSSSMQPLQNQVEQQEVNLPTVIPINAPMTDQQILEGIQQQNQRQQTIQQITANRNATAVKVMRNAETARSQSVNNQQVIPSDYPKTPPPADIVAKLESHQLTAH